MRFICKTSFVTVIFLALAVAAFGQSAADEYFSSTESGFKIRLPKTPSEIKKKESSFGNATLYIWQEGNTRFAVESLLFTSPVDRYFKEGFLIGFKKGLSESSRTTSVIDKVFSFKGYAGKDLTVLYDTNGKVFARGFYVEKRFFAVTATFLTDQPGVKESDIIAVMDSFDLVETAPAK
jgi:hypothetical protein